MAAPTYEQRVARMAAILAVDECSPHMRGPRNAVDAMTVIRVADRAIEMVARHAPANIAESDQTLTANDGLDFGHPDWTPGTNTNPREQSIAPPPPPTFTATTTEVA